MKNKKGDNHFLSSEILGIVLAIFGIFILLLLGSKFYGLFDSKTEIEQAREHVETIQKTIESVKESGVSKDYLLTGPDDWILTAWPSQGYYYCKTETSVSGPGVTYSLDYVTYDEQMPKDCMAKNWEACTCLCKKSNDDNFLSLCDKLSACQESSLTDVNIISSPKGDESCAGSAIKNEYIYVSGSEAILISSQDNKIIISSYND